MFLRSLSYAESSGRLVMLFKIVKWTSVRLVMLFKVGLAKHVLKGNIREVICVVLFQLLLKKYIRILFFVFFWRI